MADFPDGGYDQHRVRCAACRESDCPRGAQLRRRRERRRKAIQDDARRAAERSIGYVDVPKRAS